MHSFSSLKYGLYFEFESNNIATTTKNETYISLLSFGVLFQAHAIKKEKKAD